MNRGDKNLPIEVVLRQRDAARRALHLARAVLKGFEEGLRRVIMVIDSALKDD